MAICTAVIFKNCISYVKKGEWRIDTVDLLKLSKNMFMYYLLFWLFFMINAMNFTN